MALNSGQYCVAYKCFSGLIHKEKGIALFRFPSDPVLRDVWTKGFCRTGYEPNEISRLCADHFEDNCFKDKFRLELKADAVPTLLSHVNEDIPKGVKVTGARLKNVKEDFVSCLSGSEPKTFSEISAEKVFRGHCRLCAKTNQGLELIPIYNNKEEEHNDLEQKISKLLPVQISKTDELPLSVCAACVSLLSSYDDFHKSCLQAEEALKNMLSCHKSAASIMVPITCTEGGNDASGIDEDNTVNRSEADDIENICAEIRQYHLKTLTMLPDNPDDIELVECPRCSLFFLDSNFETHLLECHEKENSLADDTELKEDKPKRKKWDIDVKTLMTVLNKREGNGPQTKTNEESSYSVVTVKGGSDFDKFIVKPAEKYSCDTCDKTYPNQTRLSIHKGRGCPLPQHVCDVCGKTFERLFSLTRHKLSHVKIRSFICDKCPRTFTTMRSLERHLLTHSDERPHVCEICHRAFKVISTLRGHKRNVHGITASKNGCTPKLSCEVCERKFHSLVFLKRHILTHFELPSFSCENCCKKFHAESAYKSHVTIGCTKVEDEGNTNYEIVCDFCGAICHSPFGKKVHQRHCRGDVDSQEKSAPASDTDVNRYSSAEKPHSCEKCGKQFRRVHSLEVHHIRKHTNRDPYECRYCGRGFAHAKQMKRHQLKHERKNSLSFSSNSDSDSF